MDGAKHLCIFLLRHLTLPGEGGGSYGNVAFVCSKNSSHSPGYQLHAQGLCSACPGRESLKVSVLCDSKSKQTKLSEGEHLGTFSTLTITLQQFPCDFGYTLYWRDCFLCLATEILFLNQKKQGGVMVPE